MRYSLLAALLVTVAFGTGCQQQSHQSQKEMAMQRWNHARLRITTDMANQQFRGGSLKKATRTLQGVLEVDDGYLPAHLLLGRIYLKQDLALKSRRCFERCLKINPDQPEANYYLGVIHEKINETDQALVLYRKALAGSPDHSPYLLAVVDRKSVV